MAQSWLDLPHENECVHGISDETHCDKSTKTDLCLFLFNGRYHFSLLITFSKMVSVCTSCSALQLQPWCPVFEFCSFNPCGCPQIPQSVSQSFSHSASLSRRRQENKWYDSCFNASCQIRMSSEHINQKKRPCNNKFSHCCTFPWSQKCHSGQQIGWDGNGREGDSQKCCISDS